MVTVFGVSLITSSHKQLGGRWDKTQQCSFDVTALTDSVFRDIFWLGHIFSMHVQKWATWLGLMSGFSYDVHFRLGHLELVTLVVNWQWRSWHKKQTMESNHHYSVCPGTFCFYFGGNETVTCALWMWLLMALQMSRNHHLPIFRQPLFSDLSHQFANHEWPSICTNKITKEQKFNSIGS